jgi:hypothetical protein
MFQLTLLDHIRLTFSQVIRQHKAHGQAAQRLTRWLWIVRGAELLLLAGTVAAATRGFMVSGMLWPVTALVLAIGALILYVVALVWQPELRLQAHRSCGTELWLIRERYYALLAELSDGLIDVDALVSRRNRLMQDVRDLYAHALLLGPPPSPSGPAGTHADEGDRLIEEEIERLLPHVLRQPTPAGAGGAYSESEH